MMGQQDQGPRQEGQVRRQVRRGEDQGAGDVRGFTLPWRGRVGRRSPEGGGGRGGVARGAQQSAFLLRSLSICYPAIRIACAKTWCADQVEYETGI